MTAPVRGDNVLALRSRAAAGVDLRTGRSGHSLYRECLGGFKERMPNVRMGIAF